MKRAFIFVGIIFMGLGVLAFIERGFFAGAFFDAFMLGNMPWDRADAIKVGKVITAAGGLFIFGVVLTLVGILRKEPRRIDFTR